MLTFQLGATSGLLAGDVLYAIVALRAVIVLALMMPMQFLDQGIGFGEFQRQDAEMADHWPPPKVIGSVIAPMRLAASFR